jgi:hypothetical protein
MSEKLTTCIACDCVDEELHYTAGGAGPFCGECWGSLNDPDQALLVERRLELTEQRVEELQVLLTSATRALEHCHSAIGKNVEDAPGDICALIVTLQRETARWATSK